MANKKDNSSNNIRDFYVVEDLLDASTKFPAVTSKADSSGAASGGWQSWRPRYLLSTAKKVARLYTQQAICE